MPRNSLPTFLAVEARRLRGDGLTCRAIADHLKARHQLPSLSPNTVLRWVDPDYADKRCATGYPRRDTQSRWKFRLGGRTHIDAYKDAFVLRLHKEGVPRAAIKKVCDVVFDEAPSKARITELLTQEASS